MQIDVLGAVITGIHWDVSSVTCSLGGQRNSFVFLAANAEGISVCLISMYRLSWSWWIETFVFKNWVLKRIKIILSHLFPRRTPELFCFLGSHCRGHVCIFYVHITPQLVLIDLEVITWIFCLESISCNVWGWIDWKLIYFIFYQKNYCTDVISNKYIITLSQSNHYS